STVDPIRELVVGADVIELSGRLVVPRAPGLAAVDADDRALVAGEQDDLRVVGVDPDGVVIVAAGCTLDGSKCLAAVGGAIGRSVGDVDDVWVLRVCPYLSKIATPPPKTPVAVDALPALAGVVGPVDAPQLRRVDHGVEPLRIAGRHTEPDAPQT